MRDYVTNYEEAVELLYRIPRFNSNHSLEQISKLLTRMGQPDRQMKIVHVAGTNGKGSTSAYLAGLLEHTGMKVGLFTSPHLVDMRERFRVNGAMISKALFVEAVQYILGLLKDRDEQEDSPGYTPCYFDMIFFIGMYAFWQEQVDILILETGLGGRLDATNAVSHKALTLITHIGLDHTEYLGGTLEEIAGEKAGIMRPEVPCIVGARNDSVAEVFQKKATELGTTCRILSKEDYACQRLYEKAVAFSYFSSYYGTVPIQLNTTALYQADNATLALAGYEALMEQGLVVADSMTVKRMQDALWQVTWAGRMEEIREGVFLDGAHNTDGIGAFLESVAARPCSGRRILVFSAVSDKDYREMLRRMAETGLFSQWIITQVAGERRVAAEKLYEAAAGFLEDMPEVVCHCTSDLSEAIQLAFTKRQQTDDIYIVGSLYLVGQAKVLLDT